MLTIAIIWLLMGLTALAWDVKNHPEYVMEDFWNFYGILAQLVVMVSGPIGLFIVYHITKKEKR